MKPAIECISSTCEAARVSPSANTEGHIHSIETCGTVDGPGLRYVLFLSGCPLRCLYCHNPDAQGRPRGKVVSVEDTLKDVLKYKNFIKNGGLTISGGEPLMQPEFVKAMFRGAKKNGIHTTLDTSGYLGAKASDELLELTDLILLDIKSWNPVTYKKTTGVYVEPTLRFAKRLSDIGKSVWIRFVLVPGLTDAESNIEGIAKFVSTLGNVDRIEILPFHKMGEHKYEELGIPYELSLTPTPTPAKIERAKQIFAQYGLTAHS
ncbi:pyruvate formate-lyase-activating protein [Puniceicoccaceae bacterium K14]|nr:pyruvate formate-lyase-activating protein [Puniceicoccaceae bacterium K14]